MAALAYTCEQLVKVPGGKRRCCFIKKFEDIWIIYIYRKDTFPCGPTSTLCTPIEWYTLYKDVRACVFKLFWTCTITYGCQTKRERERGTERERERKERSILLRNEFTVSGDLSWQCSISQIISSWMDSAWIIFYHGMVPMWKVSQYSRG